MGNMNWPTAAVIIAALAFGTLAYCWRVYVRNRYMDESD